MKILVVGAGAIGGYVGAKLALAGHDVTLLGRRRLADAFAARGLTLIEPEGQFAIEDCRVVTSAAEAFASSRRFDLALFTVKTCDTQTAIDALRPQADGVDRFLSLQNGVSGEDLLGQAFGREKIIAGTILNPVSVREPGLIVLEKRKGGIGLAGLTDERGDASALAADMRRAGLVVRLYTDARAMKWSKLLLNLIGNATSAILDLDTMQVFADKRVFSIEMASLREAMQVARAQGIRFVALPGYPVPLLAAAVRRLPLPLLQPLLKPLVARGRGSKMPSLHIDLASGRRRSEIDELNGAVARIGAQLSIATPANELLLKTFKDLQSGRVDRTEWRHRADRLWEAYARKAAPEA
jgi:2-dehydropantoate 2-reductase